MDSETQNKENNGPKRALIVGQVVSSLPPVAGLAPEARWQRYLTAQGFEAEIVEPAALGSVISARGGPFLLVLGSWVADALVLEEMIEFAQRCEDGEVISFNAPEVGGAPLVAVGSAAATWLRSQDTWTFEKGLEALLQAVEKTTAIRVRRIGFKDAYWAEVTDRASAKAATWKLIKRLRWRPGGVVAKHLNRPISAQLTRWVIRTPVTPNQTTLFAFLLGAVGVYFVFKGGYWNLVLGAALLQLNSVVDGIDGELARVRIQSSEFGAYLDSVCDEIINALLFVAIGYNLAQVTGWSPYIFVGIFTGTVAFLYSLVHWHCKWKHGLGFYWWFEAYKPRKQVQRSESFLSYVKKIFWKESYLMLFLIAAIFDASYVLLWMTVPATAVVLVLFFIHIVIKKAPW
jgi:phosphatidylglycerophosphate synthase